MPLLAIDPLIKLGEVERILSEVFRPAPSRPTIIGWIEEGTLEGRQVGIGNNWFVYESSLSKLIRESQSPSQQKLAA
ncbi:MAG: hypothetical protein KF831_10250 [Acidobacteria bacterium]|nr:hypothetical protein [Acidobacteriota bacterium]